MYRLQYIILQWVSSWYLLSGIAISETIVCIEGGIPGNMSYDAPESADQSVSFLLYIAILWLLALVIAWDTQ